VVFLGEDVVCLLNIILLRVRLHFEDSIQVGFLFIEVEDDCP